MSQVTPDQARAALDNVDRHVKGGRAAALLPTPLVVTGAVAVFANFAARDIPDGWLQNVVMFSPLLVLIPVLLGPRIPALASAFGINATQRDNWRDAWRIHRLGRFFWLYMAGFLVLSTLNTTVADRPAVEDAVRLPHTIAGALVAVYIVTVISLWHRHIRRQAR